MYSALGPEPTGTINGPVIDEYSPLIRPSDEPIVNSINRGKDLLPNSTADSPGGAGEKGGAQTPPASLGTHFLRTIANGEFN